MVTTSTHSHSQHEDGDPKATQPQEPEQSLPKHETLDFPNPPQSPFHDQIVQTSQQSDDHKDIPMILDGDGQQSSKTHTTLPEPIVLANDTKNPLRSPTNHLRRSNKRKKGGKIFQNKRVMKKMENLTDVLIPIPFIPKALDLDKHEDVLKRLGLYNFTKIEFDRNIRTDLLTQLIVSYDSKKHCSYVNEKRILVGRAALARALQLPGMKQDKGNRRLVEVDLDSEEFSDEVLGFIEDFVFNWMLLHEESWVMPAEIVNWTRCIRDGHPEKLDSASLIWYKVEKELMQGDKLADCFYASHLMCLIRSQQDQLFKEEDDDGGGGGVYESQQVLKADEEPEEKEEQEVKLTERESELNLGPDVKKTVHQEVRKEAETMVDVEECEVRKDHETTVDVEESKVRKDHDCEVRKDNETMVDVEECEVRKDNETTVDVEESKVRKDNETTVDIEESKVRKDNETTVDVEECEVREDNELTVDTEEFEVRNVNETMVDVEESKVRKDNETTMDVEECKEMKEQVNGKNGLNEPILQRCQNSDINDDEEIKVDVVDDEQIEQVEDEDVEVEQEEEGATENFVEGIDIEVNDDPLDKDGLNDNFHGVTNFDLFRSRDDLFTSHGDPSFFNNGGKRVMDPEEHTHHLDGKNKRLKTNEMWEHNQNDFGDCMMRMQQWMEKAKMIHDSNEQSFVNSQCHQTFELGQLQERNHMMEMVIKSRDKELEKKNSEMIRLERELYLMVDLLAGYRKALNDTRLKFIDYRKRVSRQEEPLYKDAGPGGLVLSTRELEKQRLKQEDMMKFQTLVKCFEEECVYRLKIQDERVLKMDEKLVFVGNEVKKIKELVKHRKQNQKSHDEVFVNDVSKETVTLDADYSEEKGGGEEC